MISILGIGGSPATGKTTLMLTLMSQFGEAQAFKYNTLRGYAFPKRKIFVFGVYDNEGTFQGTDRLSMAVQPAALGFLRHIFLDPRYDGWSVVFEGDRLFNGKFIEAASGFIKRNKWIVLEVDEETLKARRAARGSENQNEQFLKGRATKYANILEDLPYVEKMSSATQSDTLQVIGAVEAFLQLPGLLALNP